jgi:hypothetical protein
MQAPLSPTRRHEHKSARGEDGRKWRQEGDAASIRSIPRSAWQQLMHASRNPFKAPEDLLPRTLAEVCHVLFVFLCCLGVRLWRGHEKRSRHY